MANVTTIRMSIRHLALAAAAVLVSACAANPKSAKSSTEVVDAPVAAAAPTPAPEVAPQTTPDTGQTLGDGDASCALVRVGFAFDSAQLDASSMQALRENADCLSKRRATALLVEGHCDERGTTEYNIALGARRADAVKRYLAALGVTAKIDSVSFGKEIPVATGSGDAAWAQNRRAEMRLPGDKRSDGQLVAGK